MILYKYATPEGIDILKNCRIRFRCPFYFNDPFECRPYLRHRTLVQQMRMMFPVIDRGHKKFTEMYNLPLATRRLVRDGIMPKLADVMYFGVIRNIGVLSLSEVNDSLLMWAHYAKQHEGLVIGFGATSSLLRTPRGGPHRVRYSRDRPLQASAGKPSFENTLLLKSSEWKHECEWRALSTLRTSSKDGEFVQFDSSCIKSVILGSRADFRLTRRVERLLARQDMRHVRLYRAVLGTSTFRLHIRAHGRL